MIKGLSIKLLTAIKQFIEILVGEKSIEIFVGEKSSKKSLIHLELLKFLSSNLYQ